MQYRIESVALALAKLQTGLSLSHTVTHYMRSNFTCSFGVSLPSFAYIELSDKYFSGQKFGLCHP